jgi:hypothetical protein
MRPAYRVVKGHGSTWLNQTRRNEDETKFRFLITRVLHWAGVSASLSNRVAKTLRTKWRKMPDRLRTFEEVVAANDPEEIARLNRGEKYQDPALADPNQRKVCVHEDRYG